jgi:hypothetical protein
VSWPPHDGPLEQRVALDAPQNSIGFRCSSRLRAWNGRCDGGADGAPLVAFA